MVALPPNDGLLPEFLYKKKCYADSNRDEISITAYPQNFLDIIVTCEYPRLFDSHFRSLDFTSPDLTEMP